MSPRRLSPIALSLILAGCTPSSIDAASDPGRAEGAPPSVGPGPSARPDPVDVPAVPDKPKEQAASGTTRGPDALVAEAEEAFKAEDPVKALQLLTEALDADPTHRKALLNLAVIAEERAGDLERPRSSPLFLRSAAAIRALGKTYSPLTPLERYWMSPLIYNEACTHAVEGRSREALESLAESVDAGFAMEDLIGTDKELDSIRKEPGFAGLLERVVRNAQSAAEEKARRLAAATVPFPFHFALSGLDGKTVTLDDFRGAITIVTFWGTWCAPCRHEVGHYKELLARHAGRGLKVVGIAYEHADVADVQKKLRAFVRERAIAYPCLVGDDRTREQVPNFEGYPTTIYLDPDQTVRVVAAGECSLREMEAIVDLVRRSAGESR